MIIWYIILFLYYALASFFYFFPQKTLQEKGAFKLVKFSLFFNKFDK